MDDFGHLLQSRVYKLVIINYTLNIYHSENAPVIQSLLEQHF